VSQISKPMKIITLRIDEEEKARLEQLAERGNVTLSRALREGAALYLGDLHGRLHAARGGRTTFHGVRRNARGATVTASSKPTLNEQATVERARAALNTGLDRIRETWLADEDEGVVLAALRTWLSLVGEAYCGNDSFIGWSWFLKDYCPGYENESARNALNAATRAALAREAAVDVGEILEALSVGLTSMLADAEGQERVRRAVLPTWRVLERELS
jgi:hypothetical protein